jgi:hypothetical protein
MTFENRLQRAREAYVGFYREKLIELKGEHPTCVAELLIQPNGAKNPTPFSLLRVDAMYGSASSPSAVRVAFPVEPVAQIEDFQVGRVCVHLGAISWEQASLTFEAPSFDLAQLRDWLSTWIDDAEVRAADDLGIAGVVHSIAWESSNEGLWVITIDFGSAPVASAVGLIEALGQQGITECYFDSDEESD